MACNVCSDFQSWSHGGAQKQQATNSGTKQHTSKESPSGTEVRNHPDSSNNNPQVVKSKIECPLGYKELGNSTWAFLHTAAAYYPNEPSKEQQTRLKQLISAVSVLYPCEPCAEHMRKEIKIDPPIVDSQKAASLWLCRFHNKVNRLLGKTEFDCSRTDERWKDGPADGSCF